MIMTLLLHIICVIFRILIDNKRVMWQNRHIVTHSPRFYGYETSNIFMFEIYAKIVSIQIRQTQVTFGDFQNNHRHNQIK